MLQILDSGPATCDRMTRREWMRIGSIGLGGLTLPQLVGSRAQASSPASRLGKAKSVIVFGLLGGPPQQDTWDPKPDAPLEIRGPFGTIPSRTPGLRVGELMPMTAGLTDKIAVLRAVVTNDNAHSSSGYQMLTGVPHLPLNVESATPKAPNNWPSIGSIVRYLRPGVGRLPSAVTIPEHIWNDGNFPWPGQDAGILGRKHDPWLIHCDPSNPKFRIDALDPPDEVPAIRLSERRGLLDQINHHLDAAQSSGAFERHDSSTQKAFELVSSGAARTAFDMNREPGKLRDRYGRSRFAQSCLLARRLVEAGVSLVQINWTRIANLPNQGGWDTHAKHNESVKDFLMPMMDRAFSALVTDLDARGLLDETLVVWFGEFGRTPKFNANGGRDHWGSVFSLAMAGGGIRGGVVYGSSDKNAAYPADGRVEPRDLIATIFHCLGYAPDAELRDTEGRPFPLSRGNVIRAIV
ncbi:MAG: DUF1501 domain-containing protein [Planctomycetaceae bacterium]|nr:DUF1501 domain-containing protein [Planctomycetaceae bacterium]